MKRLLSIMILAAACAGLAAAQGKVTKETVEGIQNFARVETTIACAGATKPESLAQIKKMGFVSVFNLREATEPGADLEGEAAAAKAAGIKYFSLPFNGAKPDPAVVDKFLKAISEKGAEPAFIHCASANRASAFWYVKRALVDKWDDEKAMAEATALGLTSAPLKAFVMDYVAKHRQ